MSALAQKPLDLDVASPHFEPDELDPEIAAADYVMDGSNRELFIRNPGWKTAPVVEMQFPIAHVSRTLRDP